MILHLNPRPPFSVFFFFLVRLFYLLFLLFFLLPGFIAWMDVISF